MDKINPNATLTDLRDAVSRLEAWQEGAGCRHDLDQAIEDVVSHFRDLDNWQSRGGPRPDEWIVSLSDMSSDMRQIVTSHAIEKMRQALAKKGITTRQCDARTNTGMCDRPLDERGYCDRASDHLETP